MIVRYHLGSVIRGSLLTFIFAIPNFLLEIYKSFALLCRKSTPGCTDCMLRSCYCLKCHQKWLRYFTKYSYIFLALFGEGYYDAARKSYYLINRNRERMFVPAIAGDFGMFIIKMTITLSGTAISFTLVTLSSYTPKGQPTSNLIAPAFIGLLGLMISGYIAQIFGGSMQACMNTIIICRACDEEMFTREQRYKYDELQDYLDQIYEEMTEQQRENKELINMHESKKAYQKTKIGDDGAESTSVMRPFFNQNNEFSAPVVALNLDEDEDNAYINSKPGILFNKNIEENPQSVNVSRQEFQNSRENSANISERKQLISGSSVNRSYSEESRVFLNSGSNGGDLRKFTPNRSGIDLVQPIENSSGLNQENMFLSPNKNLFRNNSNISEGRTNKVINNSNAFTVKKSQVVPVGSNSSENILLNPGKPGEKIKLEPIKNYKEKTDESSIEVEPNEEFRPKFPKYN